MSKSELRRKVRVLQRQCLPTASIRSNERGELYFSNMRHQCAGLNVVWATFCPMWLDSGLKHTREGIPGDNTDDTCLDLCIPLLPLHEGEVG